MQQQARSRGMQAASNFRADPPGGAGDQNHGLFWERIHAASIQANHAFLISHLNEDGLQFDMVGKCC